MKRAMVRAARAMETMTKWVMKTAARAMVKAMKRVLRTAARAMAVGTRVSGEGKQWQKRGQRQQQQGWGATKRELAT
jgi:hypothetical protein